MEIFFIDVFKNKRIITSIFVFTKIIKRDFTNKMFRK